jgi:predicted ferric reductase
LALYTIATFYLLTLVDAPLLSDHFVDDVAFRAAWVALTQIPLVYVLSAKYGPLNLLVGMSHERINWAHRWVGRVLLLSATIHVGIMKASISTEDILHSNDQGMTVVRYGVVTYAMLIWIAVSSILPLRKWSYKAFYINHYITTLIFLVIAFQHVPTYSRVSIYLASSIVLVDKFLILYFTIRNNISIGAKSRRFERSRSGRRVVVGFPVRMTTPSPSVCTLPTQTTDVTTIVRIANIPFSWKPGQHVRLYIPALGRFEMHPFTPANCSVMQPPPLPPRKDIEAAIRFQQPRQSSEMLLLVKAKSGFTKRLAKYHQDWLARPCPNATEPADNTLTAYIDGPYGVAPKWHEYENLVLVASSTGVSFILAILDRLEQLCFTAGPDEFKTRDVKFVWVIRHLDPACEEVVKEVVGRCSSTLRDFGIHVAAEFWSTCPDSRFKVVHFDPFAHLRPQFPRRVSGRPPLRIRHPDEIYDEWDREAEMEEMGLKFGDVQPFVTEVQEYESEEDESEEGTLVDGDESDNWSQDEDPLLNNAATQNDDAYRPLPEPRREAESEIEAEDKKGCQCALIQHQRRKLSTRERDTGCISQKHGSRPGIQRLLEDATQRTDTMIAVCGNANITRDVQTVAAHINADFARGRREGRVDVHIESQG